MCWHAPIIRAGNWCVQARSLPAGPPVRYNKTVKSPSLCEGPCCMSSSHAHSMTAASQAELGLQRALLAAQTAEDNRATNVVVLDMRELTPMFDYFVLATSDCTGRAQHHLLRSTRTLQTG